MIDMEAIFTLTAVGLIYDGIGVTILGFAFFQKPIKEMMIESLTEWGGNDTLLRAQIQSKTDGVVGTVFLVTGFALQWLGSIGIGCDLFGKILLGFLILSTLMYALILRKKIINAQEKKGIKLKKEHLGEG